MNIAAKITGSVAIAAASVIAFSSAASADVHPWGEPQSTHPSTTVGNRCHAEHYMVYNAGWEESTWHVWKYGKGDVSIKNAWGLNYVHLTWWWCPKEGTGTFELYDTGHWTPSYGYDTTASLKDYKFTVRK